MAQYYWPSRGDTEGVHNILNNVVSNAQYSLTVCLPSGNHVSSTIIPIDSDVTLTNFRSSKLFPGTKYNSVMGKRWLNDCISHVSISLAIVVAKVLSVPLNVGWSNRTKKIVLVWLTQYEVYQEISVCVLRPSFVYALIQRRIFSLIKLNMGLTQLPHKQHQYHSTCFLVLTQVQNKITYLLTPWRRVLLEKLTGSAASQ